MLPGRGAILPGRAACVQAPQHAVVDLAGDLLLLQHLLNGLPGGAGLDRLPALAGLLGLEGNTEVMLPVGLGSVNRPGASQDAGGTRRTPGKETHAVRAGWGLSSSPERWAPGRPALPSANGPPSSPQPSCASSGTVQHRAAVCRGRGADSTALRRGVPAPGGEGEGEGRGRRSPCAPCRYPAPSPSRFSLPSLKDQGAGSARPASRGAWAGTGGHSPFCSRRYSAFSRIQSSAFTRASASFRMYWGRAQGHSEGTPQAQPQACLLLARQSGSRPPTQEGRCVESGLKARHTPPSPGQPGGCTLPSSSQPPGTEARPARPQAPWSHDGRAAS